MAKENKLLVWQWRTICWCGGGKKIVGVAEENKLFRQKKGNDMACKHCEISTFIKDNGIALFFCARNMA